MMTIAEELGTNSAARLGGHAATRRPADASRRGVRLLLCVPVFGGAWQKRAPLHRTVFGALGGSLARASHAHVHVVIAVNGGAPTAEIDSHLADCARGLVGSNSTAQVERYSTNGKIQTVNAALEHARAAGDDGFMVLDDDVIVDAEVVPEAVKFLRRRADHIEALCFHKYSVPSLMYGEPSNFQREMARLFHPTACRLLFGSPECELRSSGSAYVLPRATMRPFPDPCNEAEELAAVRHEVAVSGVRTWYPASIAEEAQRRYGHRMVNERSPVARPRKDTAFVVPWADVAKRLGHRGRLGCKAQLVLERGYESRRAAIRVADRMA